jgi:hypothetical protein
MQGVTRVYVMCTTVHTWVFYKRVHATVPVQQYGMAIVAMAIYLETLNSRPPIHDNRDHQ